MYITKIELINIQKHAHLVLKLRKGVNVLWGKTGCGKSAIIRAFQWCMANAFSGDDIRRDNTKKSSVAITLDSNIIVKRTRSESVNRYEIIYPDDRGTKVFDSVGRTLPDVVKDLFSLPIMTIDKEDFILNIHSQDDPPYLISNKATFRSKVLNKLTGNDLVDKIIKAFNSDVLALARDERTNQSIIKTADTSLSEINEELESKKELLKKISVAFNNLEAEQEELSDLESIYNRYNINIGDQNHINIIEIPDIENIDILKSEANLLNKVDVLYIKLQDILRTKGHLETVLGKDIPEANINLMRKDIEDAQIVEKLAIRRTKNINSIKETNEDLDVLEGNIGTMIVKYNLILENHKDELEIECPNCHSMIPLKEKL